MSDRHNYPGRVTGPFDDLDRPPLRAAALRRALVTPETVWTALDVLERTTSTNADLAERARAGAEEGAVLLAEAQSHARGRLGRDWSAPPRAGLFCSVLFRPGPRVPSQRWGWLTLLASVAAAEALSRIARLEVRLKWPNDLLVTVEGEERKLAGVLAERVDDAVVLGLGVNVTLRAAELPVRTAGSLTLAGAETTDRDPLLRALLRGIGQHYQHWREAGGDPESSGLRAAYQRRCTTLGRRVHVTLPGAEPLDGVAERLDEDGRLLVRTPDGEERPVSAGDVLHVRNEDGGYAGGGVAERPG